MIITTPEGSPIRRELLAEATAQAAADAARATRERRIVQAHADLRAELEIAIALVENDPFDGRYKTYSGIRLALDCCQNYLQEWQRLIAQRDGMPVSDGPDTGERRYG